MPKSDITLLRLAEDAASDEPAAVRTLSSAAYMRLRREIIRAELAPGQKIHIRELADRYGTGLAPIREALNRLTSEALVIQTDQRGFSVPPLDVEDLDELVRARCLLNSTALRESIAHGDRVWEEAVLLACHRLARTPRTTTIQSEPGVRNPNWEDAHRAFHLSLVAGCRSKWLITYCEQLFDAAERYRYISRRAMRQRASANEGEHQAIMQAVLDRDADLAVELLNAHFNRTAELVRAQLQRDVAKQALRNAG
jgi:DNA-binding GntR family transcriptional regulator